jgi:hypothetical protein
VHVRPPSAGASPDGYLPDVGIRERLTRTAQPLLAPGEVVQQVFRAGKVSRPGGRRKSIVIVVGTPDSIVVLGTSPWSTRRATGVRLRYPRSTPVRMKAFGDLRIGDDFYQVSGTSAHPQARELVNTD